MLQPDFLVGISFTYLVSSNIKKKTIFFRISGKTGYSVSVYPPWQSTERAGCPSFFSTVSISKALHRYNLDCGRLGTGKNCLPLELKTNIPKNGRISGKTGYSVTGYPLWHSTEGTGYLANRISCFFRTSSRKYLNFRHSLDRSDGFFS